MDLEKIKKSRPIEPYIECDGWYCQCRRCWYEITPKDSTCHQCGQAQDWLWFTKK